MQASDRYGSVSHKSLAKFVMLFGVVFFLLYSNYRKESVQCIAKVTETLEKTRSVSMLCSPAYKAEIQALDPVCLPARCGRMISDDIVTEAEAHALLNLAKKGLAQGRAENKCLCSIYKGVMHCFSISLSRQSFLDFAFLTQVVEQGALQFSICTLVRSARRSSSSTCTKPIQASSMSAILTYTGLSFSFLSISFPHFY